MRPISEIIIHCTATQPDWWLGKRTSEKVAEVKRWHVSPPPAGRGWNDIGYHFLIDRDGTVAKGRPLERTGAHVAGHNTGTIGISLFGGHGSATTDHFHENFTPKQEAALRKLLTDLQTRFGPLKITGHNDYAAKACPGFKVSEWLKTDAPRPDHVPAPVQPKPGLWAALIAAIVALFKKG